MFFLLHWKQILQLNLPYPNTFSYCIFFNILIPFALHKKVIPYIFSCVRNKYNVVSDLNISPAILSLRPSLHCLFKTIIYNRILLKYYIWDILIYLSVFTDVFLDYVSILTRLQRFRQIS